MSKDIQKKEDYLPPSTGLDPVLAGVRARFNMEEEFRVFLDRNEHVRNSKPDVGFLLFLIEQQREAIANLECRVATLEGLENRDRIPYRVLISDKKDQYYYCPHCKKWHLECVHK